MNQTLEEVKKVVKDCEEAQKQVGAFRATRMKARAFDLIARLVKEEKEEEWWN